MRVLIAGCGYVGEALARELLSRGDAVTAVVRRHVPDLVGLSVVRGDVCDRDLQLPRDVDAVVYGVGADDVTEASYRRAYVDGVRNVLDATDARARRCRVVFMSSTRVYAQDAGEDVDERSAVTARGLAATLLEGEALVRGCEGGVVVRLAGIYGPGRDSLVHKVATGAVRCNDTTRIGNRIHRDDAAGVIAHVLGLATPDACYVGVDDAPVSLCETYRWLAHALGVVIPVTSAADGEAAPSRGTRKHCRNGLIRARGYELRFPTYREGYAPLVRRYLASHDARG